MEDGQPSQEPEGGDWVDNNGDAPDEQPDPEPDPEPELTYPEGRYGNQVGDVVLNLSFVDAQGQDWTFGDHYLAQEHEVLVFVTGAMWCGSCRYVHQEMNAVAGLYGDALVVLALYEDDQFGIPTAAQAARWQDDFELSYPVLADVEASSAQLFSPPGTANAMVIDLSTMKVLWKVEYWDRDGAEGAIRQGLDDE